MLVLGCICGEVGIGSKDIMVQNRVFIQVTCQCLEHTQNLGVSTRNSRRTARRASRTTTTLQVLVVEVDKPVVGNNARPES